MNLAARFQPGGTVREDAIYVERAADRELLEALGAGELCYVLAPRQIGKSSLRVRTARALRGLGARVATIDLTRIGAHDSTADGWYFGLVQELATRLQLDGDPAAFWQAGAGSSPVYRFARYLREVVLARIPERIVVFIDEIDTVLALPFSSDDFFAALREASNLRAEEPDYARLTFCLLGVATPNELIADPARTPFNVGRAVALQDFTAAEAGALLPALGSAALLDRVLWWTAGHPYMTMRLCGELVRRGPSVDAVDELAGELFLATGRVDDSNLAYAERRLLADPRAAALLRLYGELLEGRQVPARRDDEVQAGLRLTGMASAGAGGLRVRNRIFAQVFDGGWVREQEAARVLSEPLRRWLDAGRRPDLVLCGQALDEARAWAQGRPDLSPAESDFLLAGLDAARREEQQTARRQQAEAQARSLRRLLLVGGALFAVALGALGFAFLQYRRAEQERLRALGSLASALARQPGREVDAVKAGLQAAAADVRAGRTPSIEASSGLMAALNGTGGFPSFALPPIARLDMRGSADGKTLSVLLLDGDVLVFDVADLPPARSFSLSPNVLHGLALSSDGSLLAASDVACEGAVFEVATGKVRSKMKACSVAFGADGALCFERPDGVIVAGGRELRGLPAPPSIGTREQGRSACSFSADGKTVLGHEGGELRLWDAASGQERLRLSPGQPIFHARLAPDGLQLAATLADHSLRFYDARDGRELRQVVLERPPLISVDLSFSDDGKRILLVDWARVEVRDSATLAVLAGRPPGRSISGARFFRGLVATLDMDGYVRFFDEGLTRDSQLATAAHPGDGRVLAVSADGASLATGGGGDGRLKVFGFGFPAPRTVLHGAGPVPGGLTADGRRLFNSTASGGAAVWDTHDGSVLVRIEKPASGLMGLSSSLDGRRLALVHDDGGLEVRDGAGALLPISPRVKLEGSGQRALQLSPTGGELLVGDGLRLRRFDLSSGRELAALGPYPRPPVIAAYSPDGKLAATFTDDGTGYLFDPASGRQLHVLRGYPSRGNLSLTADHVYAASPLKGLWAWNARTGEPELGLPFLPAYASGVVAAREQAIAISGLLLQLVPASPGPLLRAGCAFVSLQGDAPEECR